MFIRTNLSATLAFAAVIGFHVASAIGQINDRIDDVPASLEGIGAKQDVLAFHRGPVTLPVGGHLQGIQLAFDDTAQTRQVLISHDSLTAAYLVVSECRNSSLDDFTATAALTLIRQLPSDGKLPPLRHAGGFQLAGKVLAIGVEDNQDKKRSQIQFWSIVQASRLQQRTHLTISRSSEIPKEATAGAVGLVECENDFLLAVGNWDCRAIDFYRTNGEPLADVNCRFEHALQWRADSAATDDWKPDTRRGAYQALNFVRDQAGNVWLLGFETTPLGHDVIDLFQVDLAGEADRALCKIASKSVSLPADNHFRYAGGVAIRNGKLLVLSTERNFKPQGETRLNVLR